MLVPSIFDCSLGSFVDRSLKLHRSSHSIYFCTVPHIPFTFYPMSLFFFIFSVSFKCIFSSSGTKISISFFTIVVDVHDCFWLALIFIRCTLPLCENTCFRLRLATSSYMTDEFFCTVKFPASDIYILFQYLLSAIACAQSFTLYYHYHFFSFSFSSKLSNHTILFLLLTIYSSRCLISWLFMCLCFNLFISYALFCPLIAIFRIIFPSTWIILSPFFSRLSLCTLLLLVQ